MAAQDCIFCKIIDGDIPSSKVYEDDHVYAFLDISQVTKGHTLVIPKNHEKDIFELEEETASHLFKAVPKIAKALNKTFQPKGMNILNNNKEFAGQSVFHYHLHLLPRYGDNDGFQASWADNSKDYEISDLTEMAEEISANQ
ncbi:histidine triad (HIT) family protein [Alkalicoccus daliensis]|uniref:Histidine triad (HIT) family protein n=1 Tax=Alkalicoccus daliensis TaxID=745820 RepID=A0A1H0IFQ9_9BACI|nr:histidine triad (HIT) family protein [Alkalicoccus daliensis]